MTTFPAKSGMSFTLNLDFGGKSSLRLCLMEDILVKYRDVVVKSLGIELGDLVDRGPIYVDPCWSISVVRIPALDPREIICPSYLPSLFVCMAMFGKITISAGVKYSIDSR